MLAICLICLTLGGASDPVVLNSAEVFRWPAAEVQYYLGDVPVPLNWRAYHSEARRAVAEWRRRTGMRFIEIRQAGQPNTIDILFAGHEGCRQPFRDGELAHTFYPPPNPEPIAGDLHINPLAGVDVNGPRDLYSILLHELGHSLGLPHGAGVMSPLYQQVYRLTDEDVAAWQQLYGKDKP